jgi:peptide/nickel transport system permease protein
MKSGETLRGKRQMMTVGSKPHVYESRFSKRMLFGTGSLFLLAGIGALAPYVTPAQSPFAPILTNLSEVNKFPLSPGHLLGTDYLGRDILQEAMWGARASLEVGLLAAALAAGFGSMWGTVSAFAGGIVDSIMMRIVDGMLAIPSIILLLALNSLITTPGLTDALPHWLLSTEEKFSASNPRST